MARRSKGIASCVVVVSSVLFAACGGQRSESSESAFDRQEDMGELVVPNDSDAATAIRLLLGWLTEELLANIQQGQYIDQTGLMQPLSDRAVPFDEALPSEDCDMSMEAVVRHAMARLAIGNPQDRLFQQKHGEFMGLRIDFGGFFNILPGSDGAKSLAIDLSSLPHLLAYPRLSQGILMHEYQHIADMDCNSEQSSLDEWSSHRASLERRSLRAEGYYLNYGATVVPRPSDQAAQVYADRFEDNPEALDWLYGLDFMRIHQVVTEDEALVPSSNDLSDDAIEQNIIVRLGKLLLLTEEVAQLADTLPTVIDGNAAGDFTERRALQQKLLSIWSDAYAISEIFERIKSQLCQWRPVTCGSTSGRFDQRMARYDLRDLTSIADTQQIIESWMYGAAERADALMADPVHQEILGYWQIVSTLPQPLGGFAIDFARWLQSKDESAERTLYSLMTTQPYQNRLYMPDYDAYWPPYDLSGLLKPSQCETRYDVLVALSAATPDALFVCAHQNGVSFHVGAEARFQQLMIFGSSEWRLPERPIIINVGEEAIRVSKVEPQPATVELRPAAVEDLPITWKNADAPSTFEDGTLPAHSVAELLADFNEVYSPKLKLSVQRAEEVKERTIAITSP